LKPDESEQSSSPPLSSSSSSIEETTSKTTLKRKNLDNFDEEVVEAKSKPGIENSCKHKIKTRSQTARAQSKLVEEPEANQNELTTSKLSPVHTSNDQTTEAWLSTFREWNSKHKLTALEQILELCEHTHIKHVHNFIEPKLQRDYISELPKELILLLLTYVRPKDLYKLAQVSHYWHQTANDTILWKNICKRNRVDLNCINASTSMLLNEFTTANSSPGESGNEAISSKHQENVSNDSDTENAPESQQAKEPMAGSCSPSSPTSSLCSEPTTSKSVEAVKPAKHEKSSSKSGILKVSSSSNSKKRKQLSQSSQSNSSAKSLVKLALYKHSTPFSSSGGVLPWKSLSKLGKNPLYESLQSFNQYKRAYLIDYNVDKNWCQRPLPKPLILRSHDDHVITCLKFDGFRVVSGSDDCTLKVWCALTGQLLQTLVGHTGGVWASQLKDNIVISGSTDRSVRVWNIDTGECVHILTGHTSTVRCLALHGTTVISGSRDSLLRVWNIETGKCMQILRGHCAAVRCVCFDGKYVVSGSYDFTIRVWNPVTNECLHILEGHLNRVYSLLFDGERIVSGSLDTTIIVWNVHTGAIIHKLTGHHSLTSGMQIKGDILVSGNADSTVKIWSLKTGDCMHTLSGCNKHMSAVTCLAFNDKFVVSSSDDGTVKLWNLETGEFIRNLLGLDSGGRGGVVWRISMHKNKLVCAVGSRIGVEETKLIVLDFDWPPLNLSSEAAAEETSPVIHNSNSELSNILNAPIAANPLPISLA